MPGIHIEKFYRIELVIHHEDCSYTCERCNGSGEGMADGTTCWECKGWGEIKGHMQGDRVYDIEWFDKNTWEVVDGDDITCDGCGYNFLDDIHYELDELEKQGKITADENIVG